jgi:hypothetical protein
MNQQYTSCEEYGHQYELEGTRTMATWPTMTTGGIYGSDVTGDTADEATAAAEAAGYDVLDVMDGIVVIAD